MPKHTRISITIQTPCKMYGASEPTMVTCHYAQAYEKYFAAGNCLYQANFDGLEKAIYKFTIRLTGCSFRLYYEVMFI
jgi:hypothetical protein